MADLSEKLILLSKNTCDLLLKHEIINLKMVFSIKIFPLLMRFKPIRDTGWRPWLYVWNILHVEIKLHVCEIANGGLLK